METIIATFFNFWPFLALLCLSAIPAAYMHAHDHGKINWRSTHDNPYGFFGALQASRKYKKGFDGVAWYYTDKPAFLGSTTFLIMLVDAYHASQALMRILMSLSVTLAIGAPWWVAGLIWAAYATIHSLFYKLLSR